MTDKIELTKTELLENHNSSGLSRLANEALDLAENHKTEFAIAAAAGTLVAGVIGARALANSLLRRAESNNAIILEGSLADYWKGSLTDPKPSMFIHRYDSVAAHESEHTLMNSNLKLSTNDVPIKLALGDIYARIASGEIKYPTRIAPASPSPSPTRGPLD